MFCEKNKLQNNNRDIFNCGIYCFNENKQWIYRDNIISIISAVRYYRNNKKFNEIERKDQTGLIFLH